MPGNQVCKLRIEGDLARFAQVQQRQFVKHIGKPLAFAFVGHVHPPKRILDGLITHRRLGCQRHFGHMHDGGAYHQVRIELIVQVKPHHRLALHLHGRLVFQRDADRRTGRDNAFVQDGHHTGSIIDGIIHIFGQYRTTGRHLDGAPRHVGGAELYLGPRRGFIFPFQLELILFGNLAGDSQRRVVELLEHIFVGNRIIVNLPAQVRAERFDTRKDDLPVIRQDSHSLDEVVYAIRMRLVVGVVTIQVQHPEQDLVGNRPFRQIVDVCAGRIALVHDIQLELLLLDGIGPQRIDVFHHQVPERHIGRHGNTFQQLHIKAGCCRRRIVGRELTHLKRLPVRIGIVVSDTQHFVRLQLCLQRDISQLRVNRIFGFIQQTGAFDLLVLRTVDESSPQRLVHRADITCAGELLVKRII